MRVINKRTGAAVAAALLSAAVLTGPAQAATVAHWRFEGDGTGFLSDTSGNGHALSTAGTGTVTQVARPASGAGSAFPATVAGQPNSAAASFPGGSAPNVPYLTAADSSVWEGAGGTTFTLEAMVNFGSIATSTTEYVAGHFGSTSERAWYVAIRRETGSPFVRFFADPDGVSSGGNVQWDFGAAPLTAGNDYYIAVVADLTQGTATARPVTLYVQDLTSGAPMQTVTQNQASNSLSAFYDASVPFTIGATNAATSPYSGLVDEIRFSDAALSPGELLVAVPEPVALAPLAIAGLALVRRRRR
jgi:hypothetical protein